MAEKKYDYESYGYRSLPQIISDHAGEIPDRIAIRQKRYGVWNEITWPDLNVLMRQLAAAMIDLDIKQGSKIGILSENRSEWVITQFAAMSAGATVVGMYPTSPANEIEHLVNASDTEILFIEDQEQFDKIKDLEGQLPNLKKLVVFDNKGLSKETYLDLVSFETLKDHGRAAIRVRAETVQQRIGSLAPEDTALMVFTSGSTGKPKAAEISNANIHEANCKTKFLFAGMDEDTNVLSYLPLCHVAEQNMTVLNCLSERRIMNFGESLRTIIPDLRDVAPQIFFAVPRIWEKMQSSLFVQGAITGPVEKLLLGRALKSAEQRAKTPRADWSWQQKASYRFWDLLVYRHLRSFLGLGRMKMGMSAAAPISLELLEFFRSIGLNIQEIWGMTETTGAATIQPPWGASQGRVGMFAGDWQGKIADDGELLVKAGSVFKGYYRNPEATAETIQDGWLHTGDIAEELPDGSFSIMDRKKDIMINAAGKNLTPTTIENAMKSSTLIKECIVIADRRPYVSALIQIDFDTVRIWAESKGLAYTTFRSLVEKEETIKLIDAEVQTQNKTLARVEQIKKFHLLPKELDHDDGEVTATLKVRRAKVYETFADDIERMY